MRYWLHNVHCVYDKTSGALASTAVFNLKVNNVDQRLLLNQHDKYKHVLWDPEAAHKTESKLTKFTNRHGDIGKQEIEPVQQ